ncbi:MAG: phytanoyl-CoA dioxygenase family protein [Alphaproteobacteria bacterium]|nr:phytanoyl-CoA dioxygenase family protein [Alphaproteobacteria bacterium]
MAPRLERLTGSATSTELCEILGRDGAVIVEGVLTAEQLGSLNADLDRVASVTAPGLRHPSHEDMIEFYGHSTIRRDGLPAKSPAFVETMLLPLLCEAADYFLLPNCEDYLLNTGQLIQIGPGETAQMLHRDEDAWQEFPAPRPPLQVEAMFALTDFTSANGATRVVPGSHRWPLDREAMPGEITQAEMKAGSALFYLGSAIHGDGCSTTTD